MRNEKANKFVRLADFNIEELLQNAPNDDEYPSPETVCIIGNGIIENGWEPYRDHLLEVKGRRHCNTRASEIAAARDPSIFLARHSFRQRFLKSGAIEALVNDCKFGQADHLIETLSEFKFETGRILTRYLDATKLRRTKSDKKFGLKTHSLESLIDTRKTYGTITTNWDLCILGDSFLGNNIIQLHGRCDFPDSAIFPTDFSVDDMALWEAVERLPNFCYIQDKVNKILRPKDLAKELYDAHLISERWLRKAKTIIVYGTAFNSYDSELLNIIPIKELGSLEIDQEVIIVNPEPKDRENVARAFGLFEDDKRTLAVSTDLYSRPPD
jgi:hypothetical protein